MGVQLLAATVTSTYFIYYIHTWMSPHQFRTWFDRVMNCVRNLIPIELLHKVEPQVFWGWDERTAGASSYIYISKMCLHNLYPVIMPTRCINLFTRTILWKQLIKKFDFDWFYLLLLPLFASCTVSCRLIKFFLSLWHFTKKKKPCLKLFVPFYCHFYDIPQKKQTSRQFNFQEWNLSASKVFSMNPHPSRAVVVCFLSSFSINTLQLQISVTKRKIALTVMKLEKKKKKKKKNCCVASLLCMHECARACACVCVCVCCCGY